ncbi:hypothetical protein BG004_006862 [Podila humilis]|nr:hypothetical protein BG004_006862 [Podila humilis]
MSSRAPNSVMSAMAPPPFPSIFPRIEFTMPQMPGKARKRHKVATSCNRCRQNKRKCDSEVPCSNCKRNNVDCCYTDAQLSRSLWGDSPLSIEKVQGVVANRSRFSVSLPRIGTTGSNGSGGSEDGGGGKGKFSSFVFAASGPYVSAHNAQAGYIDDARAHQVLHSQSRQLSQAMRVLHPGPQHAHGQTPISSAPHSTVLPNRQGASMSLSSDGPRNSSVSVSGSMSVMDSRQYSASTSYPSMSSAMPIHHNSSSYDLYQPSTSGSMSQPQIVHGLFQPMQSAPTLHPGFLNMSQPPPTQHHISRTSLSHGTSQALGPTAVFTPSYPDFGLTPAEQTTERLAYDSFAGTSKVSSHDNMQQHWDTLAPGSMSVFTSSFSEGRTQQHHPSKLDSSKNVAPPVDQVEAPTHLKRMQKVASDMLAIKRYDLSLVIPRHISQEQDEFWVAPEASLGSSLRDIPRHLLTLPRDASYLVDVFFEVINRTVVELYLMEPETPHALFLLNITFMTACKNLGGPSDIRRAFQFQLVFHIDGKLRLSRMQGTLLGSLVVYGVFIPVIGLTHLSGSHKSWTTAHSTGSAESSPVPNLSSTNSTSTPLSSTSTPPSPNLDRPNRPVTVMDKFDAIPDLQAESHEIQAKKGVIPEAVYQARLWTFWGYYVRDSIARLYFGWPYGLDTLAVTAELPRIENSVGLGGKAAPRSELSGTAAAVIGKRRNESLTRDHAEKVHVRYGNTNLADDQVIYRGGCDAFDDDDDDDDETRSLNDDDDDLALELEQEEAADKDRDERTGIKVLLSGKVKSADTYDNLKCQVEVPKLYSSLSKSLLEQQAQGRVPGVPNRRVDRARFRTHMNRMQDLVAAEDDMTDGGSYARALFLEEIKLWSVGRRVGQYLNKQSGSSSVSSVMCAAFETTYKDAKTEHWTEQAWTRDLQLQMLQADLMAWEAALPAHLQFRPQVDQEGINHKVNGKICQLMTYYYTITILLQSAYLPIQQYLASANSSRSRASSAKPDDLLRPKSEVSPSATRTGSHQPSEAGNLPIINVTTAEATEAPSTSTGGPPATNTDDSSANSGSEDRATSPMASRFFVNTPHRICSDLANTILHHVELLIDTYPNWCVFQAKINHSLVAAMRLCCLNARLMTNSPFIREEAKAGFRMGSNLLKRLTLLPMPLTVRDWPAEEDLNLWDDIEEQFRTLVTNDTDEDEKQESNEQTVASLQQTVAQVQMSDMENEKFTFEYANALDGALFL